MANREEISDMISDDLWKLPEFKKDFILRFDKATLKITKINRKAKRVWAEHTELVEQIVANTHYGHNLDATEDVPYCTDCEVYIDEAATLEGKSKVEDRNDSTLEDGTPIK